jgi:hypothetical protein
MMFKKEKDFQPGTKISTVLHLDMGRFRFKGRMIKRAHITNRIFYHLQATAIISEFSKGVPSYTRFEKPIEAITGIVWRNGYNKLRINAALLTEEETQAIWKTLWANAEKNMEL